VPVAAASQAVTPWVAAAEVADRELPSIPVGERGNAWMVAAGDLVSRRPMYTQAVRDAVFLDAETGMLVHKTPLARLIWARAAPPTLTAVLPGVRGAPLRHRWRPLAPRR
jgi:hypothetical protein